MSITSHNLLWLSYFQNAAEAARVVTHAVGLVQVVVVVVLDEVVEGVEGVEGVEEAVIAVAAADLGVVVVSTEVPAVHGSVDAIQCKLFGNNLYALLYAHGVRLVPR